MELALADLETVERQLEKHRKSMKSDKTLGVMVSLLEKTEEALSEGVPIHRTSLTSDERSELQPFFLLTNKPALAIVNLDENQIAEPEDVLKPIRDEFHDSVDVIGMCIQLEAEAALLPADQREEL